MLILLPPSEGKSPLPGEGVFRELHPEYADDAAPMLRQLRALKSPELGAYYGIKDAATAKIAHAANLHALDAPALPALQRYTGVVYQHIEYRTMKQKAEARNRILVVSAFFGVVRGGDALPLYKLSMTPALAKYWRPINAARLEALSQGRPILSLLPQAHAKAIAYQPLIELDFLLEGGRRSAGHFGKAIKGKFVRFLIEYKVSRPQDFRHFNEDGYRFNGENFVKG